MEIETKLLNAVLAINSRNLTDKHIIPYFTNIMFDVKDGKCTVVTGDEITEISTYLKVENAEEVMFCIDGTSFMETIKLIDDEFIKITIKKSIAIIQAGKNKYRLGVMDAKHFPRLITKEENFVSVPITMIKHMENVSSFIKTNDTRISMTGVNMQYIDNTLHIQGTDAFVFYDGKVQVEDTTNNCIINKKIVDIIGCFKDSMQLDYAVDNKCAVFTDGSITVKARLINDKYPDANPYFKNLKKSIIDVDRNKFSKMIKRANIYAAKGEDRKIVFEVNPEAEQVRAGAEDKSVNKKFLEIFDVEKMSSEEDIFALNPLFLSTVLNAFETDKLRIKKNIGKREAVFFTDSEESSGIDCFIAPVNLED